MFNKLITIIIFVGLLGACASKPVLYPNQKLKKVGKEAGLEDISLCMDQSEKYIESGAGKRILKGAGSGSIIGAAMGAVSGLITGDVVGGLASGAAVGAVGGGASAAISPDQLRQAYTNKCLSDKGYKVIGWD
ncbi:MAG: cell envelope biogenesis protein OmpA [Bacteriovoracaceae bacterium]|jgi:outer membrane lipoprotein SlyB|nr:cell envelope biogenesis protein OmpA [Bacteriovoracaceae bacterium]